MFALAAFVAHAQLAQNVSRRRIVLEMRGKDAVQAEIAESEAQHFAPGLGGVTLSPIRDSQPIAEFGVLVMSIDAQADAADLPPVAAQGNGQPDLVGILRYDQKPARILVAVGIRNAQR